MNQGIEKWSGLCFRDCKTNRKEIIVNRLCARNKKSRQSRRLVILLGLSVLAVLTGALGAVGYGAASESDSEALGPSQISVFDPFVLSSTVVALERSDASGSASSRNTIRLAADAIRISSRPDLRSPFRPAFTPSSSPVGVAERPVLAPPGRPR